MSFNAAVFEMFNTVLQKIEALETKLDTFHGIERQIIDVKTLVIDVRADVLSSPPPRCDFQNNGADELHDLDERGTVMKEILPEIPAYPTLKNANDDPDAKKYMSANGDPHAEFKTPGKKAADEETAIADLPFEKTDTKVSTNEGMRDENKPEQTDTSIKVDFDAQDEKETEEHEKVGTEDVGTNTEDEGEKVDFDGDAEEEKDECEEENNDSEGENELMAEAAPEWFKRFEKTTLSRIEDIATIASSMKTTVDEGDNIGIT